MAEKREPTQKTQPKGKGAKPIEIPVPKRSDFDKVLKKAATAKSPDVKKDGR
jgi:hypothetical protein